MLLFDAHCHLQDRRLSGSIDAVMGRARAAGVAGFSCCATGEPDWPAVRDLAGRFPDVVPSLGVHPAYLGTRAAGWKDRLRERLQALPAAGVGEIGLDRTIEEANDAEQMAVFREQLDLAREFGRPVSVHCRRAWGVLLEMLPRLAAGLPGFVVHSFSGAADHIAPLVRCGGFFSFSGVVTRSRNRRGQAAAQAVPLDRLLIETDAPDLMPSRPDLGPVGPDTPNEPANLACVCRRVAELRGMPPEELAGVTLRNARRLFLCGNCCSVPKG